MSTVHGSEEPRKEYEKNGHFYHEHTHNEQENNGNFPDEHTTNGTVPEGVDLGSAWTTHRALHAKVEACKTRWLLLTQDLKHAPGMTYHYSPEQVAKKQLELGQVSLELAEAQAHEDAHVNKHPELLKGGVSVAHGGPFNLTETGNAERLIHHYGNVMRWVEKWKKWLVYDGTRWDTDGTPHVRQFGLATVRAMYEEAATIEDKTERQKLGKYALQSESEKARRATLENAKSLKNTWVKPDLFDADPWLLNVANGTLDLRTGKLRPHSATDYSTKLVPIIYDAKAQCPEWEEFLTTVMDGDGEVIDFLQKAIGYSLTGDVREDAFFLLHGEGSNGKSTFLNTLRALLGEYSQQMAFSTLLRKDKDNAVNNDVADLAGVRLAVASEVDEGRRLSMSILKAFTGRDKIRARHLHCEFFEFPPQFKMWLACNHKPIISDTSHAAWRRPRLIPFLQTFEGDTCDLTIGEKLLAELPGILNWALTGCLAWQKEGLPTPKAVKIATEGYKAESDVIGAFLDDCCEINPKANAMTVSLYESYANWCKKSGEGEPNTKKAFGMQLQRRGFEPGKSGGLRVWKGIRLATNG